MFAVIHIISPAGAATAAARPSTNSVRSKIERTMTLPICGRRYGGSSSVKDDGTPRRIVFESREQAANVMRTDRTISSVSRAAPANELNGAGRAPATNREISDISVGNLPLQGTKPFVAAAMRRSRGESIMRQPVTPAALQPKPMHIVRACFPQAPDFLNLWSRLKATLGRYPESSSRVKSGKNIAIGGSMTATTHDSTRYTPSMSAPVRASGAFKELSSCRSLTPSASNAENSSSDG